MKPGVASGRSPDLRFVELRLAFPGLFRPSGVQPTAEVLHAHSYGVVADSHRASQHQIKDRVSGAEGAGQPSEELQTAMNGVGH